MKQAIEIIHSSKKDKLAHVDKLMSELIDKYCQEEKSTSKRRKALEPLLKLHRKKTISKWKRYAKVLTIIIAFIAIIYQSTFIQYYIAVIYKKSMVQVTSYLLIHYNVKSNEYYQNALYAMTSVFSSASVGQKSTKRPRMHMCVLAEDILTRPLRSITIA